MNLISQKNLDKVTVLNALHLKCKFNVEKTLSRVAALAKNQNNNNTESHDINILTKDTCHSHSLYVVHCEPRITNTKRKNKIK